MNYNNNEHDENIDWQDKHTVLLTFVQIADNYY